MAIFLKKIMCSGCDAVGRALDSNARDLRFEASHRQFCLLSINCVMNFIENTKI